MASKLRTVAEVVRTIPDGALVALGGFAIARNVITVVHELIRQQKKNLTLSQCVMGMDTDLLVGAGLVSRLIVGGGSLDKFGLVQCVNRARESGEVVAWDFTSLSVCFSYLAGALGISFIPIKSLLASEVLERLEGGPGAEYVRRIDCPFTGEQYVALRAITPDVALVHVQAADEDGNCHIHGPRWENEEQAKAARRVILIAEELAPTELFRQHPARTIIPAHRVEAVILQPFGAHPTAVYSCYDYDSEHLELYVKHARTSPGVRDYIQKYILGSRDFSEYLEKVGGAGRRDELKADPVLGY
ncbi:MAG: CoA transferase subunit A [Acidobacteria bacterium]|nr:CoA transferase subunit A [Acidobacteriota bacterium]